MSPLPKGLKTDVGWNIPGVSGGLKKQPKPSKYHNKPTWVDGIRFASQAEAERYGELKWLVRAGTITKLRLQPRYLLKEAFVDSAGNEVKQMEYVADFEYVEKGKIVVEDVKGEEREVFKLKSKLFRSRYPEMELRLIKKET